MNGRRRKDEPFNPFAPNASQKARDRKDKSHRPAARQRTPEPVKPTNDLAAKQKAAMEAFQQCFYDDAIFLQVGEFFSDWAASKDIDGLHGNPGGQKPYDKFFK